MNSSDLLSQFRAEMVDQSTPPLWSDDEFYTYLDAAQKKFCTLAFGISDSFNQDICRVEFAAGTEAVSIDARILKIKGARHEDTGVKVDILNFENLDSYNYTQPTSDYGMNPTFVLTNVPGPTIQALVTDMDPDLVRAVPIPSLTQSILLSVLRLPLNDIDGPSQDLEIRRQHQYYLLYWVKHLALLKQDAETFDKGRSDQYGLMFRQYCDEAKAEQERREYRPRTVSYGGI